LTTVQFKAVYDKIVQYMNECEEMKLLNSKSESRCSEILQGDYWWSGLMGVDLHPKQNSFQGLACLKSRKTEGVKPSTLIGKMLVNKDGGSWEWVKNVNSSLPVSDILPDCDGDSRDSAASTVIGREEESLHDLKNRMVDWVQCSIIMPSPNCVGAKVNLHQSTTGPLKNSLTNLQRLENKRSFSETDNQASDQRNLWKSLVFDSTGLSWFRDALGGREETKKLFSAAYTNIQNISKPREVSEAANSGRKGACPPWALVHVSGTDACICSCQLMSVPFKQHKRHRRNGVVFCFFGCRVFVSCMDAECRQESSRDSSRYYALAKELERIHLGTYCR
jgi:hypothetical protein